MLAASALPSAAQDLRLAELEAQPISVPAAPEPIDATSEVSQPAAPKLTPAVLAAYIARQRAQKGFNIFGEAPASQLTTAAVSAYAAVHYRTNAALDAIEGAVPPGPLGATFSAADAEALPLQPADSSITGDMLERYAHHGFVPTARRVAHANQERLCLTKAIYHEARGESDNGQWAVANVIINRAFSKRFPGTMCGVVYQNADQGRFRCQFTFACDGEPDMATERRAWAKANQIASAAYSEFQRGKRPGIVPSSALYYHTTSVSTNWGFRRVAQIGSHVFFSPM